MRSRGANVKGRSVDSAGFQRVTDSKQFVLRAWTAEGGNVPTERSPGCCLSATGATHPAAASRADANERWLSFTRGRSHYHGTTRPHPPTLGAEVFEAYRVPALLWPG